MFLQWIKRVNACNTLRSTWFNAIWTLSSWQQPTTLHQFGVLLILIVRITKRQRRRVLINKIEIDQFFLSLLDEHFQWSKKGQFDLVVFIKANENSIFVTEVGVLESGWLQEDVLTHLRLWLIKTKVRKRERKICFIYRRRVSHVWAVAIKRILNITFSIILYLPSNK